MIDPGESQAVRYVGQTVAELSQRLGSHLYAARRGEKGRLYDWLRSLLQHNQKPKMQLLEQTEDEDADDAERFWIGSLKDQGADLFNRQSGGGGGSPSTVRVVPDVPFDWDAVDRDYTARGVNSKARCCDVEK